MLAAGRGFQSLRPPTRLAVIGKLSWIKRQQARFEAQPRQSAREMVSGESHYLWGHRYRLRVIQQPGPPRIVLRNKTTLELHVQPEASVERRERLLQQWHRRQLKELIPPLLEKWQRALGVQVADWGIKKMKTKWGACNVAARRIWLNLELAKKPMQCLESLVVHELVHLLERHHNDRFMAIMDKCLPQWRLYSAGAERRRRLLMRLGTTDIDEHIHMILFHRRTRLFSDLHATRGVAGLIHGLESSPTNID